MEVRRGEGSALHRPANHSPSKPEHSLLGPSKVPNSAQWLQEWEAARKALKHVGESEAGQPKGCLDEEDSRRGEQEEAEKADPYLRRASTLFKLLDEEHLLRRLASSDAHPLAETFTLRFVQPAKLTATGGRKYPEMPELQDGLLFRNGAGGESMDANGMSSLDSQHFTESEQSKKWDPTRLLADKLYKVDWNPLVEKRSRFRNMEGHLEGMLQYQSCRQIEMRCFQFPIRMETSYRQWTQNGKSSIFAPRWADSSGLL